jgi:peptide/nickel transport system ATP-binding protein
MTASRFDISIAARDRLLVDAQAFPVEEGAITFLFGESGIGKSLIGKALFGILDESEFRVRVNGMSYGEYRESAGARAARTNGFFMFQEPSSHLNPLLTLEQQMKEGTLARAADPLGAARELWRDADRGTLPRILPVYPKAYRPSGGEKQRILAAMAFTRMDIALAEGARAPGTDARAPGLFVFDEPTGSLDREARDRFLDRLFARFRLRHETILLITHDYGMISYVQSRHRDLGRDYRFMELFVSGGGARTREFDPARFLTWLGGLHAGAPVSVRTPLLRVEDEIRVFGRVLRFSQPGREGGRNALSVRPGELVYLKAGSGIGKTTVAKIVVGLQKADYFRFEIDGVRLGDVSPRQYWRRHLWGKKMTMAFQHADESLNPRSSVDDTLRILNMKSVQDAEGVAIALARLFDAQEIPELRGKKVWQLSGGQKQRLNLLRAFALETPLIILDEPLSALDFESIDRVLGLIREALARGRAILLISHNEDIFDRFVSPESVHTLESADAPLSPS